MENLTMEYIKMENGRLVTPDHPVIPYIEGDGIGPEIWQVTRAVLDAAVARAYGGNRSVFWKEVYAGQKAHKLSGSWLPEETLQTIKSCLFGIKGPLETPVGKGMRSLNVAMRKNLDLYVCLRPVRWFTGVPSPVLHPERVNMVIFRENTEDLYAGIEFADGSPENKKFLTLLKENFPEEYARLRFPESSGIGIKPVSREGSQRLVLSAVKWALQNKRKSVTLIHKGNIMKYTEGAFRSWGYEAAEGEFGQKVYTWAAYERTKTALGETAAKAELAEARASGRLIIKDVITDAFFAESLAHPEDFDVVAATNLNGDYVSDALAAQVGGLGIAPGANMNMETGAAVFEATHGTAPRLVGSGKANPGSMILSGEMMLFFMGWKEAADLVIRAFENVIAAGKMTSDLAELRSGAEELSTGAFGEAIIREIGSI